MIFEVIEDAIKQDASDIHLTAQSVPIIRVNGKLILLNKYGEQKPEQLKSYLDKLLNPNLLDRYQEELNIDTSLEHSNTRFRVHIYKQKGNDAYSLRLIPKKIPRFKDMNLPKSILKFTLEGSGLVLVTGITGSGKSTTLATLIGEINENQEKHIITVEDPIEFIHEHNRSVINQREVGVDVTSFDEAVRAAMREDPDILLVGEMRDLDTIKNAITMAETGHLVFATLHTKSVAETVDRIIDVFPGNQQEQIRIQLSNTLKGIVTQDLIERKGGGRVACCEIMFTSDAMRNLIRTQANTSAIHDNLQMNSTRTGSQTKTQALAELAKTGMITKEVALKEVHEDDKEEMLRLFKVM